jgi:hypothetical protein
MIQTQAGRRALLAEVLRSGAYQQTTRRLHNLVDNTYCCLGVACELAIAVGGITLRRKPDEYEDSCETFDGTATLPPDPVLDWYGFTYADANQLAIKNDHGMSFDDVADVIVSEGYKEIAN